MSLIHDMLKDLDRQKRREHALPRAVAVAANDRAPMSRRLLITFLTTACLAVSAYCIYLLESVSSHRQTSKTVAAVAAKPLTPIKMTPKIVAMSQRATGDGTEIKLYMSKLTNYHAISDEKKLVLVFDHTQLTAKLHANLKQAMGIADIRGNEMNHHTEITILLKPGSKIRKLALVRDQGQYPALQILIAAATLAKPAPRPSPAAPVKPITQLAAAEVITQPIVAANSERDYEAALSLIKIGQRAAGVHKLETLLQKQPRYTAARAALAALYLEQKENEKSLKVLEIGLHEAPAAGQEEDYLTLIELKTRALMQQGRLPEALALLKENAPEIENHQKFYALMAAILTRMHLYREAIATYTELASLYPGEGQWWLALGQTLEASGDGKNAMTAYAKAKTSLGLSSQSRDFIEDRLALLSEGMHATS